MTTSYITTGHHQGQGIDVGTVPSPWYRSQSDFPSYSLAPGHPLAVWEAAVAPRSYTEELGLGRSKNQHIPYLLSVLTTFLFVNHILSGSQGQVSLKTWPVPVLVGYQSGRRWPCRSFHVCPGGFLACPPRCGERCTPASGIQRGPRLHRWLAEPWGSGPTWWGWVSEWSRWRTLISSWRESALSTRWPIGKEPGRGGGGGRDSL